MKAALLLSLFALHAHAAHSPVSTFTCVVSGFDTKEVKGLCDPDQPKREFKIPRDWILFGEKLKVGQKIKVAVEDKELAAWLAANPGAKK